MVDLYLFVFADRLARVRGGLDAVEAVKTGVEKHTRLAESATVQAFSAIRATVDSREKEILKVDLSWCGCSSIDVQWNAVTMSSTSQLSKTFVCLFPCIRTLCLKPLPEFAS